jgi:septin family protein
LDIAFLRSLQDRVNIVPVIAKADTLTPNELGRFKQTVSSNFQNNFHKEKYSNSTDYGRHEEKWHFTLRIP